ncbi:MAG: NAD-dependent epimerase/dehydratase family protein [Calditrichaceae bacterium]|nr:NAD-dependent epimerase/dehydratase family protein [Calditrichaceae bacterium]RQV97588.1 MAG: NAD-dependent epimerase/dehydratase family protein [Calditrichota bacterium]
MKILFIGGTGIISSACSQRCIERGYTLYLLNRGQSFRPLPEGAIHLKADINDAQAVRTILEKYEFDVIVNWIVFHPDQAERDISYFSGKCRQYVFISSASAYQTPPQRLPVTESTPLNNPFCEYSRNKIACEELLIKAYRESGFPVTIVRPSHTYDKTAVPLLGGYMALARIQKGKPIIIHGDGTSLWVMTHHRDFAKGFVGLLGNPNVIGEAFHITSDEVLCWNQIAAMFASELRTELKIAHVTSDILASYSEDWYGSLLGDKTHSMIFDNSKIKSVVPDFKAEIPFHLGVKEIIEWYNAHSDKQVTDHKTDKLMDEIIKKHS